MRGAVIPRMKINKGNKVSSTPTALNSLQSMLGRGKIVEENSIRRAFRRYINLELGSSDSAGLFRE